MDKEALWRCADEGTYCGFSFVRLNHTSTTNHANEEPINPTTTHCTPVRPNRVSIQFMEAHSRSGAVKPQSGAWGDSRSRSRGSYIKSPPSTWGYGDFRPEVRALHPDTSQRVASQPSSPCANRHVSKSLNIQHWAFPLHPLLRLICDGPDRPRKTPCCCVRI